MRIAVDFDGTVVHQDHREYEDLETPLYFIEGASRALRALARAGHTLILYSARANRALREDWRLNPLWMRGEEPFDEMEWRRQQPINEARYQEMIDFVGDNLPGVFKVIDDGYQGKVTADLYIDDKAIQLVEGGWSGIAGTYGENPSGVDFQPDRGCFAGKGWRLTWRVRVAAKMVLKRFMLLPSFCKRCGRDVRDFVAPDYAWAAAIGDPGTTRCYDCFSDACASVGIDLVWALS